DGIRDFHVTGVQTCALPILVTALLHRMSFTEFKRSLGESTNTLLGAGFVLVFTFPMVRILINSGVNLADLPSMPVAMANAVANEIGRASWRERRWDLD